MNKAPVIGWVATSQRAAAAPSMLDALERAGLRLLQKGARRAEIVWPRVFDGLFEAQKTVQLFETARALAPEYIYRRDRLSARLVALIDEGRAIGSHDYVLAMQLGRACVAAIDSLFAEAEVLLTPSAPGGAPAGLASTGDPVFNRPWQLLGCPMISLPVPASVGVAEGGLPLGITVVARPGEDTKMFTAAAWIESHWGD
jgi:amidase